MHWQLFDLDNPWNDALFSILLVHRWQLWLDTCLARQPEPRPCFFFPRLTQFGHN